MLTGCRTLRSQINKQDGIHIRCLTKGFRINSYQQLSLKDLLSVRAIDRMKFKKNITTTFGKIAYPDRDGMRNVKEGQ